MGALTSTMCLSTNKKFPGRVGWGGGTLIVSICTGWADFFGFIFFLFFFLRREGLFFDEIYPNAPHTE